MRMRWKPRGQVVIEYFVIFAVVAVLTVIGANAFIPRNRNTGLLGTIKQFVELAVQKVAGLDAAQ